MLELWKQIAPQQRLLSDPDHLAGLFSGNRVLALERYLGDIERSMERKLRQLLDQPEK